MCPLVSPFIAGFSVLRVALTNLELTQHRVVIPCSAIRRSQNALSLPASHSQALSLSRYRVLCCTQSACPA